MTELITRFLWTPDGMRLVEDVHDDDDLRDGIQYVVADLRPVSRPALTPEAERLDAAVAVLERLQTAGYYLHDAKGRALNKNEFVTAVTHALADVLGWDDLVAAAQPSGVSTPTKVYSSDSGARLPDSERGSATGEAVTSVPNVGDSGTFSPWGVARAPLEALIERFEMRADWAASDACPGDFYPQDAFYECALALSLFSRGCAGPHTETP